MNICSINSSGTRSDFVSLNFLRRRLFEFRLAQFHVADLLEGREPPVDGRDDLAEFLHDLLIGLSFQPAEVRKDDGGDDRVPFLLRPRQNDAVLHEFVCVQIFLQLLGIHVFSVGEDDDVLLAARDVQISVVVDVVY